MAGSIADMLVGSALESSDKTVDIGGSITKGAQLAESIQNMRAQRAQIEQKKQELYNNKIEKFVGLYETAAKLPPGSARNALLKNAVPKTRDALGLTKEFPDSSIQMFNSNPEVVSYLKSKVDAGEMTLPEVLTGAQDAEWIAKHIPDALKAKAGADLTPHITDDIEALQKSERFRIEEANKAKNAETMAGSKGEQRGITNLGDLRKEVTSHPVTKTTIQMAESYDKIRSSFGGKPSAAGDISGVFAYMKMLDPASTVREGEQAQARQATGVPEQILNLYNRAVSGETLNPKQRQDFINRSEQLYRSQYNRQTALNKDFEAVARSTGINPKLIFAGTRFKAPPAEKRAAGESFDVGGQKMTKEQAKAFYEEHPQFKDSLDAKTKKALGY